MEIQSDTLMADSGDTKVTASMATIPQRLDMLLDTVKSIIDQVDCLNIHFNGYPETPAFLSPYKNKINIRHDDNVYGSSAKFFWAESVQGYHLTIDDDLIYPPNYVARLIRKSKSYDDKAIVGLHGFKFTEDKVQSYYRDRYVSHYARRLRRDYFCHGLGTGTILYHSDSIHLCLEHFKLPNMDDIWLALQAQEQSVPMVCVNRKANWLKTNPKAEDETVDSIYRRYQNNDEEQTKLANSISWRMNSLTLAPWQRLIRDAQYFY